MKRNKIPTEAFVVLSIIYYVVTFFIMVIAYPHPKEQWPEIYQLLIDAVWIWSILVAYGIGWNGWRIHRYDKDNV